MGSLAEKKEQKDTRLIRNWTKYIIVYKRLLLVGFPFVLTGKTALDFPERFQVQFFIERN